MSCMHATCNRKGGKRGGGGEEREKGKNGGEGTREKSNGLILPEVDEKHAGMHSKCVMSLGSRGP